MKNSKLTEVSTETSDNAIDNESTSANEYSTSQKMNKKVLSWTLLKNDDYTINSIKENEINDNYKNYLPHRSGSASVLYKSYIYIFGGYKSRRRLNDLYKYDILHNTFTEIRCGKNKPSPRENNPSILHKKRMYIYGGYEGNKRWLNDFYYFDLELEKWKLIKVREHSKQYAPPTLFGFSIAVDEINDIIYFFGGYDGQRLQNQMYAYNINENAWIDIIQNGEIPSPRSCSNGHIYNNSFYLFGGYNGKKSLNSLYKFNLETHYWKKIKYNKKKNNDYYSKELLSSSKSGYSDSSYKYSNAPNSRYFAASFLYNHYIYILGGYNGYNRRLNDLYKFNIKKKKWSKIETINNFSGRSSMNVHLYKNVIYCIAGYDGKNVLNDVYALKLENAYVDHSSLIENYKMMVNNPRYSDVVFILENRRAYGCKAILSVRCPFFFDLFNSYFNENKQIHIVPIQINDVSYDIFLNILNYIYTDELDEGYSLDTYINILLSAIKLRINRLVQLCEVYICDFVNKDNILELTILSYRNNCQQLCKFCLDYLINYKLLDGNNVNKLVNEPQLLAEIYKKSFNI